MKKKTCTKCKQKKTLDAFYFCARDGVTAQCKECIRAQERARAEKPEVKARKKAWWKTNKHKKRIYNIKEIYGVSEEEYKALLTEQDNCCGICEKEFVISPCVDHDHSTGDVRGLLCNDCNFLLGNAKDSVKVLKAAIEYLLRMK